MINSPTPKYPALVKMLCLGAAFLQSGHAQTHPDYYSLDLNGNGLYEDNERKALLDVFMELSPEFIRNVKAKSSAVTKAASNYQEDFVVGTDTVGGNPESENTFTTFDLDGDGKVSVEEQTYGRPPLSLLVPESVTASSKKIPWAIDIFPEWITTAFLQDDVEIGKTASHVSRGVLPRDAAQKEAAKQPARTSENSGVVFAADSGEQFVTTGSKESLWDYRWLMFTFRLDADSSDAENTLLLDVNQGDGAGMSSPKIWYNRAQGLTVQYTGLYDGEPDRRIVHTKDIVTDGETWNVLVCGIRYGQLYVSVNGVDQETETPQPPRFSTPWGMRVNTVIGDKSGLNVEWAYDAIIFGITEPSEAMVDKMTGWAAHRLGFTRNLPASHVYRENRPYLDLEDFPDRYNHDDAAWNAWGKGIRNSPATRVNSGGPRVEHEGFERVFFDDFSENRIDDSNDGKGDLWTGFGFNVSVGVAAPLIRPSEEPNGYIYDTENDTLTLAIVPEGDDPQRWRSSAIYSNNDMGYGYTWEGPKIFRIRCKFPASSQEDLAKGLFPAFWSYAIDNLFWRTSNRIEIDYFEFDGINGWWLNGLSTHYHYPYIRGKENIFAKNTDSYNRFKVWGADMNEKNTNIPGGLFVYDGKYHTWEFVIGEEMTYTNVTVEDENGGERWVEIYRCPTAATYLEDLNLIINNSLKGRRGEGFPKVRENQNYIVDWVEVLQETSQIETLPSAFAARPEISVEGGLKAGGQVVCVANVKEVKDIRYYWFADGYPLTYGPDRTYTLKEDDLGKEIRCMVKAVGARNQPEAWSNRLKP